jgi:hypothetical protein
MSATSKVRYVSVPTPERGMTEAELKAAFGAASNEDPLWRAMHQVIRDLIIEATSEVSAPGTAMNHGALAHAAGGVEWLAQLQSILQSAFDAAHTIKDEEPGKVIV